MKKVKYLKMFPALLAILSAVVVAGCDLNNTNPPVPALLTVIAASPVASATDAALNTTITATFNKAMDAATIIAANFSLTSGAVPVTGTVIYDLPNKTAIFTPDSDLADGTLHTATITTGVKDFDGNALAASEVWTFTTEDTTLPVVISTVPVNSSMGVAIDGNISAAFSEAMDSATIITANFAVTDGITPVTGVVTYTDMTATFNPDSNLSFNTNYTATITTGVTDMAGNAMAMDKVWIFTTVAPPQAVVDIGTAANYVILAKTAISTIPDSAITGDVGLSPAAQSYMTGFSETLAGDHATAPQVTGFLYAADMANPTPSNLTTAVLDMQAAYTDAAGRPTPDYLNFGSGEIGGQTLSPGLYTWGSSVTISSNATISGGADDVWIFQISGNLTTGSAIIITLSGGAQAKNIFWQVSGEVTLGTYSHFEGIILSQTAILMQTGASMNGRLLAQTQVVLDQNTVSRPGLSR